VRLPRATIQFCFQKRKRNQVSLMVRDLEQMIRELEGIQRSIAW
jgi:hypothetical protein